MHNRLLGRVPGEPTGFRYDTRETQKDERRKVRSSTNDTCAYIIMCTLDNIDDAAPYYTVK